MKRCIVYTSIVSLFLIVSYPAFAQEGDLLLLYGDDEMISIATGVSQPIAKAPSTASVITAEDIKAMGAMTIEQALESVPGLHYSLSTLTSSGQFNIRGIKTSLTPQVLIMLNGYRISSELGSGVFSDSAKINIQNISRIEIIRGPGSAIYGADAFSGVINIVTKNAKELDGFTVGGRGGSNNTKNAWAQYGTKLNSGWDIAFNLEFISQDADTSQAVSSDFQTGLDGFPWAAGSSLAPGNLDYRYESTTYNLHLNNENWKIGLDGWAQRDVGQGAGVALALDPKGRGDFDQYLFSMEYSNKDWIHNWDFVSKLSYQSVDAQYQLNIFPPGTILPIGTDGNLFTAPDPSCPIVAVIGQACLVTFTDGYIGNPGRKSSIPQLDLIALYDGLAGHDFRFNVGAKKEKIKTNEAKNFGTGVIDGLTSPIDGTLTDVTGTSFVYLPNKERTVKYISAQDVWSVAADWTLTAGVRYDEYSDFGGTTNPRVALVWNTYDNLTSKLLFGSAFRAPSFNELYNNVSNPIAVGNNNLNPETIDTIELAFSYQPLSELTTNLSLYHFETKEMINYIAGVAENGGSLNGKGLELDADWKINKQWRLLSNFAFQSTKDKTTDRQKEFTPQQQLYFDLRWKVLTDWKLSSQLSWIGNRKREAADTRIKIDDYTLVDLSIRRENLGKNFEAAFVIKNIFDEDAREPTSANTISDDFPLNERRFYAELRYHLN